MKLYLVTLFYRHYRRNRTETFAAVAASTEDAIRVARRAFEPLWPGLVFEGGSAAETIQPVIALRSTARR